MVIVYCVNNECIPFELSIVTQTHHYNCKHEQSAIEADLMSRSTCAEKCLSCSFP